MSSYRGEPLKTSGYRYIGIICVEIDAPASSDWVVDSANLNNAGSSLFVQSSPLQTSAL